MDFKRRARERAIALEIAQAIHSALGSSTMPEDLGEKNRDLVCAKFADAFDRHGVTDEAAGARILSLSPACSPNLISILPNSIDRSTSRWLQPFCYRKPPASLTAR